MFESPKNNVENSQESEKPKWENLDSTSLPDPDEFAELLNEAMQGSENKGSVSEALSKSLGEEIERVQKPAELSENITLYAYKAERNPGQNTEDYNLTLRKTDEGYEWSSAMKYNGSK